jgi:hypothetical protein
MKKLFVIALIAAGTVTLFGTTNAVDRRIPSMETHGSHQAVRGGTISGIVVDTEGKPVSQATVEARILRSFTGPSIPAQADKQGRFTMTRLEAETYQISASKEEDGYPESLSTFNVGTKRIQQITLKANEVSSGNVIRVGPKALKLFGHVVDAVTKKPVNGAEILPCRNPVLFLSGAERGGSFEILVPKVPTTVKCQHRVTKGSGTMTLKAGQINRLEALHVSQ